MRAKMPLCEFVLYLYHNLATSHVQQCRFPKYQQECVHQYDQQFNKQEDNIDNIDNIVSIVCIFTISPMKFHHSSKQNHRLTIVCYVATHSSVSLLNESCALNESDESIIQ